MGQRLTQIATRTGDDGSTGLGDGSRVAKTSARVVAMGDVDELNCTIGVLLCEDLPVDVSEALYQIQHDLFDLGGELCIPGFENIHEPQLLRLDEWLAQYNATLPKLAEFILPLPMFLVLSVVEQNVPWSRLAMKKTKAVRGCVRFVASISIVYPI
jgi:cob(I)alamin adenosyltransferase